MKVCNVNSIELTNSVQCRLDAKYNKFVSVEKWTMFPEYPDHCAISDILIPMPVLKAQKGDLKNSALLINISDQEAGSGRLTYDDGSLTDSIGSDKIILDDCDIMISKLGMPRGYIYLRPDVEVPVIGSSEFVPYRFFDKSQQKYYLYLLLSPAMRKAYACLENGKTPSHKRVNPNEFLKIRVPKLPDAVIYGLIEQIEKHEKHIDEFRKLITPQETIINHVFAEYFNYPVELNDRFGKGMSAGTQGSSPRGMRISECNTEDLAKNKTLRLSVRSNNSATQELAALLAGLPMLRVKSIVTEEIHRGAAPLYDPNGEIPVVKTAHLRNAEVLTSNEEFVTKDTFDKKAKAQVHKGDVLLASTGKPSIGKIDLVENDTDYFADSHISIIRIDEEKYNKKFFIYWFRCVLGYFQIERDYVGCTNQIELSEEQIKNFLIPDISLAEQETLVAEIERELQVQKGLRRSIKQHRKQIDEIIMDAIDES